MGSLSNIWSRIRAQRTAKTRRPRPLQSRLAVEHLEDRSVPALILSNTAVDFGSDPVGATNLSPRATTIENQDPNNVLLSVTPGGANAGDFTILSGPAIGQPLGTAPQSFRFAFTPSTQGAESATYSFATTDGTLVLTLIGTGTSPVSLSASSLDFGALPVGSTGPSVRSASVLNQDPNNVLLSITPGGPNASDFQLVQAPSVGQPLGTAPQAFRFTFTPTTVGQESATYTLATTDGTLIVALTGTGASPISLTSTGLDFGPVPVGTTGPSVRSTSILNQDPNNALLSIMPGGPNAADFQLVQAPTVGQALGTAPQAFRFTFTPSATGPESATYTLNTTDGPVAVSLTGTGASPLTLATSSLNFGSVPVGTTGPSVRSTNIFNQDPNNVLLSVTPSGPNAGDFQLVSSVPLGQAIPTGAQPLTFRFTFTPTAAGPESATYSVATTDGVLSFTLAGTGVTSGQAAALSLNHSSINFGNALVGVGAPPLGVGIWNLGQNVQLLSVSSTSPNANDFPLLTPITPGQSLPVATSVTSPSLNLQFGFIPSTVGAESATYTIHTSAGDLTLTLSGTGASPVSLNHSTVAFGNAPVGVGAPPLGVGIWNLGQNVQLLSVSSTSPNANDFPLLTPITSGQSLPVATDPTIASLGLQFGFIPSALGNESATYTIHTTAGDLTVTLTGTGTSPLSLNHSTVAFGNTVEGTGAPPLGVGIWNVGQNVQLLSVSSSGPNANDFLLLTPITQGQMLPVATSPTSASLSLQFGFIPSALGDESATYTFHTTAGDLTVTLTGTGTSPLSLGRSSLDFGSNLIGTGAPPLQVSVWNFGQNVQLLGVSGSGPNANDFPLLTPITPGQTLAVAQPATTSSSGTASLSLQFGFIPSAVGNESATYVIHTSAGDLTLTLTGSGASAVSITPGSLDCGSQALGTTTATPVAATITNQDPNNVLQSVTVSGPNAADFHIVGGPPLGTLATGSQQFLFTFTPSVIGPESATVTIQTSDGPLTLTLTGSGTGSLELTSPALDFGSVPVGTTGLAPRSTFLLNQDPANTLLSVTASGPNAGDFQLNSSPAIGSPLAPSSSFRFTFTPSTAGAESAAFTIVTTDGTLVETLTGTGSSPISVTNTSLGFGSEPVGEPTASPRVTTLINQDPNNVLLSVTPGGANPGDFQLVSGPAVGSPLQVGPQSFRFQFTPSTTGAESATFTIATTDGTEVVTLSGSGTSAISLASPNLSFGSVPVGMPNPSPRSVALLNTDPNNVLLNVVPGGTNPGDFQLVSGPAVGSPLQVGQQSFRFQFTPSTTGAESATYTFVTTDGSVTVHLSGSGTSPISLTDTSLSFGSEPVGEPTASPRVTTLLNQDPNNVLLSVVPGGTNPGDFQLVSGPSVGSPLQVGPQSFRFQFTPSTVGAESATFTIATTDGNVTVHLSGVGTNAISLTNTGLAFGPEPVGEPTASPRVTTLLNTDPTNVLLGVTPGGTNPGDFQLVSGPSVGSPLQVGPQSFRFQFTPSTVGAESATFTIATTDGNVTVHLSGSGSTPISLASPNLSFGSTTEGTTNPAARSAALLNTDPANVLLGVTAGGTNASDFQLVSGPAIGSPLQGGPQSFRFSFTPSVLGAESATFTIATTDGNVVVNLSGRGVSTTQNPTVSLSHSSIAFGRVVEGTGEQPLNVGLWNFGQNVQLLGITSSGPNANDFQLLTQFTPGQQLAVAQPVGLDPTGSPSMDLQFEFDPSMVGSESATYTIATSAGNLTLTLTGSGSSPVSLSRPSLDFGPVMVSTGEQPLSAGVWNFGQNVQLLGITSSGPNASDFQLLTQFTPGQQLAVAQPIWINPTGSPSLQLQFEFDPSTVGAESATYVIHTSAGDFTVNLSGTGTTPVSLSRSSLDFGRVMESTGEQPLSVGLWNFGQNVQLLGVTSSGTNASDFQLLTQFTPGQQLPPAQPIWIDPTGSPSLQLQFEFDPSTIGSESATYVIHTTAGDFTINLSGTGTSPVSLSHSSLNFGRVMESTGEQPLSVGVWNFGQNVQLLGITSSGPNANDFQLLTQFTPGQQLPPAQPIWIDPTGSPSLNLQFEFDPSTIGSESATYTIHTSAGDFTVNLSGTGTMPVSLSRSSLDFGPVMVSTGEQPLSVGLWNFGQNVQLLGVTSSGPNASDFQLLTQFTPGQQLPTAQPVWIDPTGSPSLQLQFEFDPSTVGAESATFVIHTSAGDLTLNLTGTGTSPVSLSHSAMDLGSLPAGTQSIPLSVGLWNFGQNVQLLGITSSGPNANDFQLLTSFTPGQLIPTAQPIGFNPTGGPSMELYFVFTPSTTGLETVTYTIHTTAGDLTITLTGTGL